MQLDISILSIYNIHAHHHTLTPPPLTTSTPTPLHTVEVLSMYCNLMSSILSIHNLDDFFDEVNIAECSIRDLIDINQEWTSNSQVGEGGGGGGGGGGRGGGAGGGGLQ